VLDGIYSSTVALLLEDISIIIILLTHWKLRERHYIWYQKNCNVQQNCMWDWSCHLQFDKVIVEGGNGLEDQSCWYLVSKLHVNTVMSPWLHLFIHLSLRGTYMDMCRLK